MTQGTDDLWDVDTVAGEDSASSHRMGDVTVLSLLHAPDLSRVGERAILKQLDSGGSVTLSRMEPKFGPRSASGAKPLFDPRLSRKPMTLRKRAGGGVNVERGEATTKLSVDGEDLAEERALSAADLDRGVVLLWAEKFVLLLHRTAPVAPMRQGFGLLGQSAEMGHVRADIHRVCDLGVPVLLLGETGTGKELVAKAIHEHGVRKKGPFVAVNMAAIPPTLAAAELFGVVRGAYTGATQSRAGYFREAEGGTIFLDEIGDIPADIQVHLLRALDNREIRPVGSDATVHVNARVVAATDANLEAAIEEGKFRAPLLHRLSGYEVKIPPLRERREDLGILLHHFLTNELRDMNQAPKLDPESGKSWLGAPLVALLARYHWPGNVRQLRNAARQIAIHSASASRATLPPALEQTIREGLAERREETVSTIPPATTSDTGKSKYRDPASVGDEELVQALVANRWRLKPTASQLNVSRTSLYTLMDNCAQLRRATQIDEQELRAFLEDCKGDLDAMSEALRISKPGLQRRMKELGLA